MSEEDDRPLKGALLMACASMSYALMGVSVKLASESFSPFSVVAGRSIVVVVVAGLMLKARGVRYRVVNRVWMWMRSLLGFTAMCFYFYAISAIPLANAVTIQFTNPLLVALFGVLLLGERVRLRVVVLSLVAFFGVVLIVSPSAAAFEPRALAAVASALLASIAYIAVRKLHQTDSSESIVMHFALVSLVLSAPAFFLEASEAFTVYALLALGGAGLFAAGGQLFMTYAYRYGRAAHVSTISYATVLFSAVLGFFILGEEPTTTALIGAVLIVSSGVGVSLAR